MEKEAEAIYFLDLSQCEPANALSRSSRPKFWTMVNYEIEQGQGVMLFANSLTDSPSVTLKLNVTGWYGIYLGIYYGWGAGFLADRVLRAKLTGDPAYSRIGRESFQPRKDGHYPEKELKWSDIAEAFWKCADLTGEAIQFARPTQGKFAESDTNIAYVKLVPLTQAEIEEIKRDSGQATHPPTDRKLRWRKYRAVGIEQPGRHKRGI
ncbi:MAG: hypothetical protein KAV99_07880 [Candidatus Latescibacteria bacterium]|nr:hypothetical protein [Candidatus Latescibacterota bacterium]